jgi:hypothetical protein
VTFNPTPEEQRLLRVVPTDIQPNCERPAEDDFIFEAAVSLVCEVAALDGGFVRFALFDSPALLDEYMDGRRTLGDASQRCGSRPSGSAIYRDSAGRPMGLLVCYVDEVGAWIEWTNDSALVYGIAHQPEADWSALYDFWARVGPTSP